MKPKLTLRDLFWLVLVCAMGCAWWVREVHYQRQLSFCTQVMRFHEDEILTQGYILDLSKEGHVSWLVPKEFSKKEERTLPFDEDFGLYRSSLTVDERSKRSVYRLR